MFAEPIRWHSRSSSVRRTNQMARTFSECLHNQSDNTRLHQVFVEPIRWHVRSIDQMARVFAEPIRWHAPSSSVCRTNQMARTFIECLQNQSDGTHVHRVFAEPIRWHARSSSVCRTNQMALAFIECLQNQSDGTRLH